jgi:hypothetical protein
MPADLEPGPLGPAFDEAIYDNPSAVKTALQAHAKVNRYTISYNSSVPTRVVYVCSKSGVHDPRNQGLVHESKRRKNTGTTKTNCKYRVAAKLIVGAIPNQWQVTVLNNEHNHDAVISPTALLHHRISSLTEEEYVRIKEMSVLGYSPSAILSALQYANPDLLLVQYNVYNLLYNLRLDELAGYTPIEWLLKVLIISSLS